jgi:lipopolysaccharide transport system permease protein
MEEIRIKGLNDFNKYKSLLSELVRKDIKIKYRNSVLGVLWSFLDPLFRMIVLTVIFSTLFNRLEHYPVYYLSGQLIYSLFVGASTFAMKSMVSSSNIWKSVYVPKYLYALSAVLSNFVTYLLSLVVLFSIMLVTGVDFTIYIIFISLPLLILLVMAFGVGLILGTINIFFRDVEHLYNVITLMLMYALPLFYPAEIIPPHYKFIQTYNPIFYVVKCSRDCFLYGRLYSVQDVLIPAIAAIIFLVLGIYLLRKYQDKFILYV